MRENVICVICDVDSVMSKVPWRYPLYKRRVKGTYRWALKYQVGTIEMMDFMKECKSNKLNYSAFI